MTSSNGNIFRVTGLFCKEFTGHRWIARTKASDADVFFDLRPNKRLNKQWWGWWFETPSSPLWRHYNEVVVIVFTYWVHSCCPYVVRHKHIGVVELRRDTHTYQHSDMSRDCRHNNHLKTLEYKTLTHWWPDKMAKIFQTFCPHFSDIFKYNLPKENVLIWMRIPLKFVPPISNTPARVQIMDWCRTDDKPLDEPMMV